MFGQQTARQTVLRLMITSIRLLETSLLFISSWIKFRFVRGFFSKYLNCFTLSKDLLLFSLYFNRDWRKITGFALSRPPEESATLFLPGLLLYARLQGHNLKTLNFCSWSDNGIRYAASVGIFFVHKYTGWWAVKQNMGLVAQNLAHKSEKNTRRRNILKIRWISGVTFGKA